MYLQLSGSINYSYYICGDFNIHVDVPVGDGHKFITFLDLCDLKQSINLLICMVTYWTSFYPPVTRTLLLMSNFVTDHALVKCTVAFPYQVAHTPNRVQYRRYHRINMSDFHSDLKNTSFVKSPVDDVVDLYEQYVHDLGNVLNSHAPLISEFDKKRFRILDV